jgi:zinc-binding alcohol dehydrogenase family protein
MKALVYEKAHTVENFAIQLRELPEPALRDNDVLVEVRAIGINPGEAFFRQVRSAEPGGYVLLGWEFAGVVIEVGRSVQGFTAGDRVFGTGDVTRDGCWAERVAVDHRIIAKLPDSIPFADAASLPIGALTASEAVFRDQEALPEGVNTVLVVGGAGAVGSLATQILKATTSAFVIVTGSRPESRAWCSEMGADLVLDHSGNVVAQLTAADIQQVDLVLSTAATAQNLRWIAEILRPFGHIAFTDMPPFLDLGPLGAKAPSLHVEMVFSRIVSGSHPERQGQILKTVAALVAEGRLRAILTKRLEGLTAETMNAAHELVETHQTIGKIVIAM